MMIQSNFEDSAVMSVSYKTIVMKEKATLDPKILINDRLLNQLL